MNGKQLEQIIKSAEKAVHYGQNDPETALLHARKSAEAICRDVYQKEIGKIPERISFGQMIEALSKGKQPLPKKVLYSLRVIQNFGGVNAHENIDECLEPTLEFFSIIIIWYFENYRKESVPTQIKFYRATTKPIFQATGEQVIPLSELEEVTNSRKQSPTSEQSKNDKITTITGEFVVHETDIKSERTIKYGVFFKDKPLVSIEKTDIGTLEAEIYCISNSFKEFTYKVRKYTPRDGFGYKKFKFTAIGEAMNEEEYLEYENKMRFLFGGFK